MIMLPTPQYHLAEGTKYKIEISDCCVTAEVTGTFIKYDYEEDDDMHEYPFMLFDIGKIEGYPSALAFIKLAEKEDSE